MLLLVQKSRWVSLFNLTLIFSGSLSVAHFFSIANFLTILRIVFSPLLLFLHPLSFSFDTLYILLGLTDILDGFIARKTKTTSKLGSSLGWLFLTDANIGDIVFCASSFIAIYPTLELNAYISLFIAIIFMLRVVNIIVGYIKEKKLILLHTIPNKATGFLLYLFPLTLNFISHDLSATVIAGVALYASIGEGYLIWNGKTK